MSAGNDNNRRVPLWMVAIIIVAALPALLLPTFVVMAEGPVPETKKVFLWLFPLYLVVAAYLAWQCYGQRTVMSWILVALMFMTDAAMMILMSLP